MMDSKQWTMKATGGLLLIFTVLKNANPTPVANPKGPVRPNENWYDAAVEATKYDTDKEESTEEQDFNRPGMPGTKHVNVDQEVIHMNMKIGFPAPDVRPRMLDPRAVGPIVPAKTETTVDKKTDIFSLKSVNNPGDADEKLFWNKENHFLLEIDVAEKLYEEKTADDGVPGVAAVQKKLDRT